MKRTLNTVMALLTIVLLNAASALAQVPVFYHEATEGAAKQSGWFANWLNSLGLLMGWLLALALLALIIALIYRLLRDNPSPNVVVNVPPASAPQIVVNVPQQPAPIVNVTNTIPPAPPAQPEPVREEPATAGAAAPVVEAAAAPAAPAAPEGGFAHTIVLVVIAAILAFAIPAFAQGQAPRVHPMNIIPGFSAVDYSIAHAPACDPIKVIIAPGVTVNNVTRNGDTIKFTAQAATSAASSQYPVNVRVNCRSGWSFNAIPFFVSNENENLLLNLMQEGATNANHRLAEELKKRDDSIVAIQKRLDDAAAKAKAATKKAPVTPKKVTSTAPPVDNTVAELKQQVAELKSSLAATAGAITASSMAVERSVSQRIEEVVGLELEDRKVLNQTTTNANLALDKTMVLVENAVVTDKALLAAKTSGPLGFGSRPAVKNPHDRAEIERLLAKLTGRQ